MLEIEKLHRLLNEANLPVVGVSADGRVDYSRALSSAERGTAEQILLGKTAPDVQADRLAAYELAGISIVELTVALWEQIVEGRPEAAQSLQARRLAVKAELPKV